MSKKLVLFTRVSLFIIYFWFGLLKLLQLSPAEQLVHTLFNSTLAFLLPFDTFYLLFALFECSIGLLALVKGFEKKLLILLSIHIFTTAAPLVMIPTVVWTHFLVPTLAGQYIIKNFLIIVAGMLLVESTAKKNNH